MSSCSVYHSHPYERLTAATDIFYPRWLYFTCSECQCHLPPYYYSITADYFLPWSSSFYSLSWPGCEGPRHLENRNLIACGGSPRQTPTSWRKHACGFYRLLTNCCSLASSFAAGSADGSLGDGRTISGKDWPVCSLFCVCWGGRTSCYP